MHHAVPLIATIAAAFGMALVMGFVAVRLKVPALVGYLSAGIVIGPATPGFVADVEIAAQLAEIGVMLLMFGVGLHFSIARPAHGRAQASRLPGAIVQMGLATAVVLRRRDGRLLGLGRWAAAHRLRPVPCRSRAPSCC